MKTLKVLKYIGFGILGLGFVFLCVYFVMLLWNGLIPSLFHGPVLSYWQTAGLFLLSKILLTGVAPGHHGHGHREWKGKYHDKFRHECREENKVVTQ